MKKISLIFKVSFCFFIVFISLNKAFAKSKRAILSKPQEFIVKYKDNYVLKNSAYFLMSAEIEQTSGAHLKNLGNHLFHKVIINSENQLNQIRKHMFVEYVEPNYIYHALDSRKVSLPNDSQLDYSWSLYNNGEAGHALQVGKNRADIHAYELWNAGFTNANNLLVAVIDSGVDINHPDLQDSIYTNPNEIPNNQIDDDNNGFIDDIHGWNFSDKSNNVFDSNGHGTHCAGVIAATPNNGIGTAGIAWGVKILPVKFLDSKGYGDTASSIEAINYAVKMGAKVLSNSWGGDPYSQALRDAIHEAGVRNVVFVAAAGNDGTNNDEDPMYPASYEEINIISVAATDNKDMLIDFSNYGAKTVHVAAPGVMIYNAFRNQGYEFLSGTSMATPHVTAVAALLKAYEPQLTPFEIRQRIMDSSDQQYSLKRKTISRGRLNAFNALKNIKTEKDPEEFKWKTQKYSLESEHPYASEKEMTWTLSHPNARWIRIVFGKFETEQFDRVIIESPLNEIVETISGEYKTYVSEPVKGDTLILRFKPDLSLEKYGFSVKAIQWIE